MRPAVLAAAFVFDPRLAWMRIPFSTITRVAAPIALRWLDRRRERMDARE